MCPVLSSGFVGGWITMLAPSTAMETPDLLRLCYNFRKFPKKRPIGKMANTPHYSNLFIASFQLPTTHVVRRFP
jgi:nitrate/TMAO reductase-like tetraheme cytochrome c subunit